MMESARVSPSGNELSDRGDLWAISERNELQRHRPITFHQLSPSGMFMNRMSSTVDAEGRSLSAKHNIIADGFAAPGNDRHLGHAHPRPGPEQGAGAAGTQCPHAPAVKCRLRGLIFWESLS